VSCDYSENLNVWFKLDCYNYVAKKRLVKTKDLQVRWGVWFSETLLITVSKSVARKCLVKQKTFM
jgi:hypothetical protein